MDAIDILTKARAAADEIGQADASVREQLRVNAAERTKVFNSIPPAADILPTLGPLVHQAATTYLQQHGYRHLRDIAGHEDERTSMATGAVRVKRHAPRLPKLQQQLPGDPDGLSLPALCAFAPELVVAALTNIVNTCSAGRLVLSAADRTARLEALAAQARALMTAHAALVRDAAVVGITITPLTENVKQQAAQALEEDALRPQHQRQDALNEAAAHEWPAIPQG